MLFSDFAEYLKRLEVTSSRLEITSILTDLFDRTSSDEIQKVTYLSLGVLAPNYEGILLNLAEKMMIRTIAIAYNLKTEDVIKLYKKEGDLGPVAEKLAQNTNNLKKLTVNDVYEKLKIIAKDGGGGSQDRKIELMADLLKQLDSLSVRFVARIPMGKLRLGFSEKTIIDALARHNTLKQKEIEESYNIRPDIGYVAFLVKENKLKEVKPKVGVPVVPMLAQRLNSTSEMIKKMGEVAVEPKFDGLRIFIHYKKSTSSRGGVDFIKIFTRNLNSLDENIFPELKGVGKYIKADEIILDTEAVGIDPKREMFLDFQKTISRRRKHEVEKTSGEVPLQFQVFDLLLVDGESLINVPYVNRRKKLEKVIINSGLLRVDESIVTKDPDLIKKLHLKYLEMGLEGVVVKRANGKYVSGRTGWNWVKMKEEEGKSGRLSDTLDCIVMGYWSGKGKRAQFGLGKILVGIKDGEKIRTLTKVGTGLTEEMLGTIKRRIDKLESRNKPKEYEAQKDLIPDVWATPSLIVEVTADSISKSTKHSLGLSLRFPRFLRIRNDKGPSEATTLKELNDLFSIQ
ncbi:MAG TPA: ATP-dependent DNA ligase [Patescibacteria group bacterium]|nr:ATP-dependent DNA ligase [Patescibacteria group bacterium]